MTYPNELAALDDAYLSAIKDQYSVAYRNLSTGEVALARAMTNFKQGLYNARLIYSEMEKYFQDERKNNLTPLK
jgi:hypothetical protein